MESLSRYALETFNVFWWTFVGALAFLAGSWLFHRLDHIDYKAEIEKGNIAAAIKLSAILLGLAAIIVTTIR
jgi:uncharacterized membrane protein YjfL (UPF0719 family)